MIYCQFQTTDRNFNITESVDSIKYIGGNSIVTQNKSQYNYGIYPSDRWPSRNIHRWYIIIIAMVFILHGLAQLY